MVNLAVAGAVFSLAPPALAAKVGTRSLTFEHTHTGKRLSVIYARGDRYVPEALTTLNAFLRDHYSGQIGRMDPKLFDLLYKLRLTLGCDQPFQIVSGCNGNSCLVAGERLFSAFHGKIIPNKAGVLIDGLVTVS